MKKVKLGLLLGLVAGVIDVVPMIIQKLSWDANISAFIFWIVAGFVIAASDIKLKPALKGLVLGFVLALPVLVLVGWQEPLSIIPILIMNLILGSLLGYLIEKWS